MCLIFDLLITEGFEYELVGPHLFEMHSPHNNGRVLKVAGGNSARVPASASADCTCCSQRPGNLSTAMVYLNNPFNVSLSFCV
jgi:hypothetical protein